MAKPFVILSLELKSGTDEQKAAVVDLLEQRRWKHDKKFQAWTAWFKEGTTAEEAVKVVADDLAQCCYPDTQGTLDYEAEVVVRFESIHKIPVRDK